MRLIDIKIRKSHSNFQITVFGFSKLSKKIPLPEKVNLGLKPRFGAGADRRRK
jgi:hypothetical protein